MDGAYGEKVIIPGVTYVVNTLTCHTGRVHVFLPKFGVQVWNTKDYNRENWYWSIVSLRTPRSIKRYPRPLRFPRETPTEVCHCPSGREVVEGEHEVRCLKCSKLIGSESFPKRFRRAEVRLRKAYSGKPKKGDPRGEVPERASKPSDRKAPRGRKHSVKERKIHPSRIRQVHGGRLAKDKTKPKKASAVSKKGRLPRSKKVPAIRRKRKITK